VWNLLDFIHIKRQEDETIPEFHVRFIDTHDKIHTKYQSFAFDS
jgi:hypothetical protein